MPKYFLQAPPVLQSHLAAFGTFRTQTRVPQETMELGIEEVRDGRTNRILWLLASPSLGQLERKRQESAANRQ